MKTSHDQTLQGFLWWLLALVVAVTALLSLRLPMDWDTPLLLYCAQAILWGHVPYAELFDVNLPLTYLLNIGVLKVFGHSDLAIRCADLLLLASICILTWRLLHFLGARVAATGVLLFASIYLAHGNLLALQRDALLLPFLIAAACLFLQHDEVLARCWIGIGCCFGCVLLIKPQACLGLLAFWAVAFREDARARRFADKARLAGWTGLGITTLLLPAVGVLSLLGALRPWIGIVEGYWPLFAELSGDQTVLAGWESKLTYRLKGLTETAATSPLWLPAAYGAFVAWTSENARIRSASRLLVGLAVTQLASVILLARFWPYHWLPCWWALSCLGALVWSDRRHPKRAALVGSIVLLQLTAPLVPKIYQDLRFNHRTSAQSGRVDAIAAYLKANLDPGDTVQPIGWTGGAVNAMLRAGARPGTSFIYTYQFHHHVDELYIQGLRRRFLAELSAAEPRFLVEEHAAWWTLHGPHTSSVFGELRTLIQHDYRPVLEGDGFTVHERREGPTA